MRWYLSLHWPFFSSIGSNTTVFTYTGQPTIGLPLLVAVLRSLLSVSVSLKPNLVKVFRLSTRGPFFFFLFVSKLEEERTRSECYIHQKHNGLYQWSC